MHAGLLKCSRIYILFLSILIWMFYETNVCSYQILFVSCCIFDKKKYTFIIKYVVVDDKETVIIFFSCVFIVYYIKENITKPIIIIIWPSSAICHWHICNCITKCALFFRCLNIYKYMIKKHNVLRIMNEIYVYLTLFTTFYLLLLFIFNV